ncbi:NADH dehydrogenase (ubiquinone) 1 alpha/beta subcomplex 1 [Capronia epimyces CBS 606.96]|uniref:Acyl carrier protein n=1 Tax=Capronia epimyces CBS 606.96 TaxID=1182542 RepID=W9YJ42_9EURO|nr:NADH dehydrogenase (ubiquinone) 1 alpha/beta subcomplex 1 [Capronia epimyces CBS 606.96]EXJ89710.1 NADH dehydrogenase (ubiquinone) 1 alpha/beta subcomplex 1 [Capronia epimyces CBS 606.96]
MFRAGAVRALYAATRTQVPRQLPAFRTQISASLLRSSLVAPSVVVPSIRCYSAPSGLSKEEVQGRIMDLLKNFDKKVSDASKITGTSHFQNDLGLDSLDTVEVVMAIEEEFSIEIPDKEADAIHSVDQAVAYISSQPDAH